MRRSIVELTSIVVVAAMMILPVSAVGAREIIVQDRQGDLGKTIVCGGQGSHEWADMLSYWSGDSPLANAGYLDMLSEWVTIKGGIVTMGMTLAAPIPTNGVLPDGAKELKWAWLFWSGIDKVTSSNNAEYGVYVIWSGGELSAALVDRTNGAAPFEVTYLDSLVIAGNALTVSVSLSCLEGATAWFAETQAWNSYPCPIDQVFPWASWVLTDLTDYLGPLAVYWPWQAMP